jgi:hypothetical protein
MIDSDFNEGTSDSDNLDEQKQTKKNVDEPLQFVMPLSELMDGTLTLNSHHHNHKETNQQRKDKALEMQDFLQPLAEIS